MNLDFVIYSDGREMNVIVCRIGVITFIIQVAWSLYKYKISYTKSEHILFISPSLIQEHLISYKSNFIRIEGLRMFRVMNDVFLQHI
jgi:hypothetical protein